MDYRTEAMKDEWRRKPYQVDNYKRDKEIAKKWMVEEFGFSIERWTITPSKAAEILDNMGLNRKLKGTRLAKYSSSMEKGLWRLSPQGIIFDEEGKLIDGQHRLESVIDADKPMDFIVFLGVPHDTPIDVGLARTTADSIRIRGDLPADLSTGENFAIVNAALGVVFPTNKARRVTDEEKAAFILHYADEITFARNVSFKGSSSPLAKKAGIRAAILFATICGVDRDVLGEFVETVNTGRWKRDGQGGALVLRGMLENQKRNGGGNAGCNAIAQLDCYTEEAIRDYIADKPRRQRYKGVEHPFSEKVDVREAMSL